MSAGIDSQDSVSDANQGPGPVSILTQAIASTAETPNVKTAIPLDYGRTISSPDRGMDNQSQHIEPSTKGMGISTLESQQQCPRKRPFIFKGEDEEIIFNDIDEDPWKYFISAPDNISGSNDDGTSGNINLNDEDNDYWVEFEHEGESPWNTNEDEDTTFLDTDSVSDPESDDTDEGDVDLPLSHFQPLPIGPFAYQDDTTASTSTAVTTTCHPHPYPRVTPSSTTNTITINFDTEPDYECVGFQLARYVAQMANVPLPLIRRVHELQGWIDEDRRGSREWRAHRREWIGGWGSPLWESWGADGEEEWEEENSGEEENEEDDE